MRFPIYKYVKLGKAWRYMPAALDRGVPIPNMIVVDGGMEHHAEGAYYVRLKRDWVKAGATPQDVIETTLRLCQPGMPEPERPALHTTAMRWLEAYGVGKSDKTKQAMQKVLKNFLSSTRAATIGEVNADHVREYWRWEVENSPTKSYRTAYNRVSSLQHFLKENKVEIKWRIPPFDEEEVEVYEDHEVAALLSGADQRRGVAYETMYKALLREKEAVYLTWLDVNEKRSTIGVRSKPQFGWRVKKWHERTIKVPRDLMTKIMALPRTGALVFGVDGKPDLHLLRALKKIAAEVNLDPAHCWLHKFRASGATKLLQSGMPLKDVMLMGGWRDLASIQRYMGRLTEDRLEEAVEAAWA